ncbi:neutral/alkaline non-lysosomal ceramidase N-terminal domain-containing protein [Neorhizobium sp. IRS_2294]|uniref:neutral/alkaline non-lysosomal ceramidase N-terminal domain-containing protein n=1 Tax=unclassified Neorhizobium TaxID=2629175 RepID=UPI003D2C1820
MIEAGAAIIDITPTCGLPMSGFAARNQPAEGAHDALTARAVVIGDTAVVVADVIGIDAAISARIRERCVLECDNIVVAALHTHGGPASMTGSLGVATDTAYLERLEDACIAAIDAAAAARRPATITFGLGNDPGIARNRRRPGGPVDASLTLLRICGTDGAMIALVTAYACHPVVLGADNRLWTADYPHFVRQALEETHPGAVALFMTGCAGDANTGHSAHASITLSANPERSYATAERIGLKIAEAALSAPQTPMSPHAVARNDHVVLEFQRRETEAPDVLETSWRQEAVTADPARKSLLGSWAAWARSVAPTVPSPLSARVTVLDWGGLLLVALPGEIFAETALSIRTAIGPGKPAFVIGFADDNPGYIPPAGEFEFGGYEVDEAHRYYGLPMTFAPGSAEALAACAISLSPGR